MPKLADLKEKFIPHIALYGPPGSRKTSFAETWGSVTEMIDCDPVGASVGLHINDQWRSERLQTEIFSAKNTDAKQFGAFTAAKQRLYQISDALVAGTYTKKVVVIDSLTAIGTLAQRSVMNSEKAPTLQQWGSIISEIEQILMITYTLPVATITIGHDMSEDVDGMTMKRVWVRGRKLPEQIPAFFNEIWYSKAVPAGGDKYEYVLQTLLSASVNARSAGQLPNNWNMNKGLRETLRSIGYVPAF